MHASGNSRPSSSFQFLSTFLLLGTVLSAACLLTLAPAPLLAQSRPFIIFDAPDATRGTVPKKINDAGQITGNYQTDTATYGFVRSADGVITEFGAPETNSTFPISLNNHGDIVGYGVNSPNYRGFVRSAGGIFTQIAYPGAQGTFPASINDSGIITGKYTDSNNLYHGFVRDTSGTYSAIDIAGAGTDSFQGTLPLAINNSGEIMGLYRDPDFAPHGFLRDAAGNIAIFDVPESTNTTPADMNNNGDVTGTYAGAGILGGFIRHADGTFETFAIPDAPSSYPIAINDRGYVCGYEFNSRMLQRGFTRDPAGNLVFNFEPQPNFGGICSDINNNQHATGLYLDSSFVKRGWTR